MKTNSLNPFDLILGRTAIQKLERQRKKLDQKIIALNLERIKFQHEMECIGAQIEFLAECEGPEIDKDYTEFPFSPTTLNLKAI